MIKRVKGLDRMGYLYSLYRDQEAEYIEKRMNMRNMIIEKLKICGLKSYVGSDYVFNLRVVKKNILDTEYRKTISTKHYKEIEYEQLGVKELSDDVKKVLEPTRNASKEEWERVGKIVKDLFDAKY